MLIAVGTFLLQPAALAGATHRHVTNVHDSGPGSLRQAILNANGSNGDVIDIEAQGRVFLQSALPDITAEMSIVGPGAKRFRLIRPSGPNFRIFTVDASGDVSISGLTVKNGSALEGGAIRNSSTAQLQLTGVRIKGSSATGTDARGGGVYNGGTLDIVESVISGNTVATTTNPGNETAYGGGVYNAIGASLFVTLSTIAENTTAAVGDDDPPGNGTHSAFGGGLLNEGNVTLTASTVAGNALAGLGGTEAGSNILAGSGTSTTFKNTVIADPQGDGGQALNCTGVGTYVSNGFNLEDDNTCNLDQTSDQPNVADAGLKPLDDNGGQTETRALLATSPAVDKGKAASLTTDQRGRPRPVNQPSVPPAAGGDNSDIGAFERQ